MCVCEVMVSRLELVGFIFGERENFFGFVRFIRNMVFLFRVNYVLSLLYLR